MLSTWNNCNVEIVASIFNHIDIPAVHSAYIFEGESSRKSYKKLNSQFFSRYYKKLKNLKNRFKISGDNMQLLKNFFLSSYGSLLSLCSYGSP